MDIREIIGLQRDLCFAENIASAIIGITSHRDKYKNIPVLLNYSDKDSCSVIMQAYEEVKKKMKEYDVLKEENERLKECLKKYEK